jgi:hypothetical protein
MNDLIISPKTKVLQLIEAYPQMEDILIQYAPAFKKLKNPVLRKTIARIATLQQAAAVGNVKVEDLINRLRKEVGQDLYKGNSSTDYITEKPDWFNEKQIESEFDAKQMLARGEQPVNQVIADLNSLGKRKIYKLLAPFLPAPLIDKATSLKIRHWIEKLNDNEVNVYFYKG